MIIFDLECSNGHIFEGWFDSSEAFEEQKKKGLISCPYCNDTNIKKVLSPVAIAHRRKDEPESTDTDKQSQKQIDYEKLYRDFIEYIKKNSEDVGADFAKEALKMHYGVAPKRNIRGTATEEEEKILREEGIEFFKIPMPKEENEDKH
ncbi:MAG: DUF1178 domain-containing protein [Deltaproteobacteria bacterium]|nr:MAG: DUF1178 domain-containing protein [Deltaproteobacteria bacterium]